MKKLILFIAVSLAAITTQAQEIKWLTFNEAIEAQKKNPKPIFMDVYTDWCGPCKMLDKNTFSNEEVINHINKNYYAVKFNAEGQEVIKFNGKTFTNPNYSDKRTGRNATHEFTVDLKVPGYPSMVIIGAKGDISSTIVGYKTPEALMKQI